MPYVNVPNDLSKIKTKIAFNLTRRQLICFGGAAAVGIPVYLLYGEFERTSGESDGRRFPGNVLAFPTVTTTVHPTQKPVALCEYLIRTYTRPGEVVADICAGSGTTAVAALNTGRRFVCFETAPAFYGPATERIRRAREAVVSGRKGE